MEGVLSAMGTEWPSVQAGTVLIEIFVEAETSVKISENVLLLCFLLV